ncbi:MAG: multicopper oxidase domain-containing protein [Candidatus Eremiobacteraeota bacterium]|nr:multicopper oxidase domain-containing protein [Candidatus Eremiobacteraeota bacterium]
MKRRLIAVTVALAWLAGCGGQSSAPVSLIPQNGTRPVFESKPDTNVNEMPEPPVVKSVNGVAKVSMLVDLSGATGFPQFVFDSQNAVTPTIRVNPGDEIVMDITNHLPVVHHDKYDINVHFHGIGSSPKAPGDDVLGTLARPGQSLHYVVHIPKNQEPGLYWYHPHVHGQTAFQVGSAGMSGAIVVNGLEHHIPGLAKLRERLIIVRASGVGRTARPRGDTPATDMDGMDGMDGMNQTQAGMKPQVYNTEPCGSDLGFTTTLNNAYQPVITIRPGEKQFFRVINASSHKTLKLYTGSQMELIAIDGFALDTWHGTPPTKMVRTIIIPPASRAEFVVTGPPGGFGTFKTLCYDTGIIGDRDPELKLATLRAPLHHGNQVREIAGEPLTVGAPLPRNVYTEPLPPIAAKRTVTFSEGASRFFINGKAFSMSDPPMYVVHTGTVEEWHIHNISQEIHDFHIHQLHFLVKEINGVKLVHPYWADSVVIPHQLRDGSPGSLVLIMDFRDPTIKGTFLFHCHILDHEDLGMMAKIQAI